MAAVIFSGAAVTDCCQAAFVNDGSASVESSSYPNGDRDEKSTIYYVGDSKSTHDSSESNSSNLFGASSHRAHATASINWEYTDTGGGGLQLPGSGHMSTSGYTSGSASAVSLFGGIGSGFYGGARIIQDYNAPVKVLVHYALSPPTTTDPASPHVATSEARINGTYFLGVSGSVLLEGISRLDLQLVSSGLIQIVVDPNPETDTPPSDSEFVSASGAIIWAVSEMDENPILPGQTPATPIEPTFYDDCDRRVCEFETDPADEPVMAGPYLTFPVRGNLGHTGNAFLGLPTQVPGGPSTGALVTGYEVTSAYSPFTSFVVPDLPPGAEGLTIDIGAGPQSVVAGETVNFGPEGLESFTLAGFDPMLASAELDAFVMGLQFTEAGLASLIAIPTLFIPPGDFSENGLVDAADYTLWRDTASDMPEGYELWRRNFGAPSGPGGAGQAVPEPHAMALLVLGANVMLWLPRRRVARS